MKLEKKDPLFFVMNVINSCNTQSQLKVASRLAEIYHNKSGNRYKKVLDCDLRLQSILINGSRGYVYGK